jgi:hypothetical protein
MLVFIIWIFVFWCYVEVLLVSFESHFCVQTDTVLRLSVRSSMSKFEVFWIFILENWTERYSNDWFWVLYSEIWNWTDTVDSIIDNPSEKWKISRLNLKYGFCKKSLRKNATLYYTVTFLWRNKCSTCQNCIFPNELPTKSILQPKIVPQGAWKLVKNIHYEFVGIQVLFLQ